MTKDFHIPSPVQRHSFRSPVSSSYRLGEHIAERKQESYLRSHPQAEDHRAQRIHTKQQMKIPTGRKGNNVRAGEKENSNIYTQGRKCFALAARFENISVFAPREKRPRFSGTLDLVFLFATRIHSKREKILIDAAGSCGERRGVENSAEDRGARIRLLG